VTLEVGARVVYPVHGVVEVVGHERRTVDGVTSTYVVLSAPGEILSDNLRLVVPEDRLEELGVRDPVSAEDAVEVLALLAARNVRVPSTWSRRFKNHKDKLRTGDVFACAEVVRNLALRQHDKPLAPAETTMYRSARHGLVSELAVAWGISDDDASRRIDRALEPGTGSAAWS
jgi:CarD family transcriptional regulator